MSVRTLTKTALLTAAALILFVIESRLPRLVPLAGVKLGLGNVVLVYALYILGAKPAFAVLLGKVTLGSIFTGSALSFMYSLSGGLVCFGAMLAIKRLLTHRQIWVCSVIGAIFHNIGQILMALLVTQTVHVLGYFPILLASGLMTGTLTGLAAQLVHERLVQSQSGKP